MNSLNNPSDEHQYLRGLETHSPPAQTDNNTFLWFALIGVGLVALCYVHRMYQMLKSWLCGQQQNTQETVLVHDGQLVFDLDARQRRAVLEVIFSETSKVSPVSADRDPLRVLGTSLVDEQLLVLMLRSKGFKKYVLFFVGVVVGLMGRVWRLSSLFGRRCDCFVRSFHDRRHDPNTFPVQNSKLVAHKHCPVCDKKFFQQDHCRRWDRPTGNSWCASGLGSSSNTNGCRARRTG